MRALFFVLILASFSVSAWAHPTYTGYSGAPSSQGTCASSCHGSSGGTVTVTGFPDSYTPGQSYTLTISRASGSTIANFNASCRIEMGSMNAGTLAAGTATATYNASGETNGAHFSSTNQASGTFTWTAPAAGTGTVRLYVGAHQGSAGGANTALVLVSNEASGAPGMASNPMPSDGQIHVMISSALNWMAGSEAMSHVVRLGMSNPPDSMNTVMGTMCTPAMPLQPGTLYYWRIDERNDAGLTPGPVWSFTTLALPGTGSNPGPADNATNVSVNAALSWTAGRDVATHDVYFGLVNPPPSVSLGQTGAAYTPGSALLADTVYYWRIDETNSSGTSTGTVWSFRTEQPNAAGEHVVALPQVVTLGPCYPNPFNANVSIPFVLPRASTVKLALYDITGREVAVLANGGYSAGVHAVQWSSHDVGSGVFLLRLTADGRTLTSKIMALK